LPFTDSTFLGVDGNGTETAVVSYQSSQWTGNTGSYSYSDGRIDATTADDAIKSVDTFTGDFELEFYITDKGNVVVGMYEISEDGTFNQNLSTGGLNSMTNSWWIKTSSVAANNDVMYGSTEVAGTVGWADGDTVKITRSSGTFTVYRNGSSLHEWSQTSSNEVRIVVAQGDVNVTLDQFCWVDAGTLGNNFFTSGSPTQSSDTPTNNYSNVTPLDIDDATLSNGNLTTTPSGSDGLTKASMVIPESGVWGVKITNKDGCTSTALRVGVAIQTVPRTTNPSNTSGWYNVFYRDEGVVLINGSTDTSGLDTFAASGEYVEIIADMDAGTVHFYTSAGDQGEYTIPAGYSGNPLTFMASHGASDVNLDWDFGQNGYDPSSTHTGALALNTANLYTNAAPAAADASDEIVAVVDNETNIEATLASTRSGFTNYVDILFNRDTGEKRLIRFSHDTSNEHAIGTDDDYQTKSTLSGTDNWGGISLKVDGNAKIRASSVSHTNGGGDTTVNFTDVGTTRYVVWLFPRISNGEVPFYHPDLTSGNLLFLTSNAAQATNDAIHTYTSNSFVIDNDEATATYDYVILPDISGITDLGVYEGNSNPNGPLVLGSVSPVALFLKNIDATSSIPLLDSARDTYNPADKMTLLENDASSENTGNPLDFLSAGFKIRGTSGVYNTATTVFISIGQASFGSSPATAR
jgi:hypothetical protein